MELNLEALAWITDLLEAGELRLWMAYLDCLDDKFVSLIGLFGLLDGKDLRCLSRMDAATPGKEIVLSF